MRGFGEDASSFLGVVAIESYDERPGQRLAATFEHRECGHDAVGDGITCGDATEDVDENRLHRRVGEDDLEPVGHDLGGGAAPDVEEVGRLGCVTVATEIGAGVGNDIER